MGEPMENFEDKQNLVQIGTTKLDTTRARTPGSPRQKRVTIVAVQEPPSSDRWLEEQEEMQKQLDLQRQQQEMEYKRLQDMEQQRQIELQKKQAEIENQRREEELRIERAKEETRRVELQAQQEMEARLREEKRIKEEEQQRQIEL